MGIAKLSLYRLIQVITYLYSNQRNFSGFWEFIFLQNIRGVTTISASFAVDPTPSPTPSPSPISSPTITPTSAPTTNPTSTSTQTATSSPKPSSSPSPQPTSTASTSPSESPSQTPIATSTQPIESNNNIVIFAAVGVTIVVLAATAIVLRKSRKPNEF